jgi:hypothetical protein
VHVDDGISTGLTDASAAIASSRCGPTLDRAGRERRNAGRERRNALIARAEALSERGESPAALAILEQARRSYPGCRGVRALYARELDRVGAHAQADACVRSLLACR